MSEIRITLPDGSERAYPEGATGGRRGHVDRLAAGQGRGRGHRWTARSGTSSRPLPDGAHVSIITADSDEGRHVLRHSTAHVMAQAVTQLYPGAKFSIGPAIEDGFYYDFDLPDGKTFSDDDLAAIEARMGEIVAADQPFVRDELEPEAALELFADQPYKREIIERVQEADADDADAGEVAAGIDHQRLPQHARSSSTCAGARTSPAPGASARSS